MLEGSLPPEKAESPPGRISGILCRTHQERRQVKDARFTVRLVQALQRAGMVRGYTYPTEGKKTPQQGSTRPTDGLQALRNIGKAVGATETRARVDIMVIMTMFLIPANSVGYI